MEALPGSPWVTRTEVPQARRGVQRFARDARRLRRPWTRKAAATSKRHADGILRYCQHPITNGVTEGLNGKIMAIKRKTCGFRNPQNFQTAIYFHCGELDLYPR